MDRIPTEVLLEILSYLSTYDLMQFCKAYESDDFLKEKRLVQLVNFSRRYEFQNFNLSTVITTKLNYIYIKMLNISYLYWIPTIELRRLLKQLENLEILTAIDTKLGIRDKDIEEYVKLKKVAVSIEDDQFSQSTINATQKLKKLKSLCLKITQKKENQYGIYLFFRQIKHLEELWIYDDDERNYYRIDYWRLVVLLKELKKFVIKSKVPLPYYDFKCDHLFKIFQCRRNGSGTEYIFEKDIISKSEDSKGSIFEPKENELEKSWELFERLYKDFPCGPKESKKIYINKDIETVNFEELNFCSAVILCNSKYVNAALQILLSRNSRRLKRLSFRSCLFQDPQYDSRCSNKKDEPTPSFKRPRKGIQINPAIHNFQKVANNIKYLTDLEILNCPGCYGEAILSAYPVIGSFDNLHKLTLEVPLLMDGLFLKEIFVKCQHLESLNLICVGQNEKFILNLCQNLKYATNLTDFKLEHKEIVIDRLLNSFNELINKKLLRIFLKCDNLQYSCADGNPTYSFFTFLTNCTQLVFFLLIVSKITMKQNSNIQRVMNNFKRGNPAKVFYVKNDISLFPDAFPIPNAHHDMIFNYTNVSVINIDKF